MTPEDVEKYIGYFQSKPYVIILLIIITLFGAFFLSYLRELGAQAAQPKSVKSEGDQYFPELRASQIDEIKKLQEFLSGKSESQLRSLFGFDGFVQYNLINVRRQINTALVTDEEWGRRMSFFEGGHAIFNSESLNLQENQLITLTDLPKDTIALDCSKKYFENLEFLKKYEESTFLKESIRNSVKNFRETIETNTNLLFGILREKTKEDYNSVLYDGHPDSKYFGSVTNAYAKKFHNLKPESDKILSEIRSSFNVER